MNWAANLVKSMISMLPTKCDHTGGNRIRVDMFCICYSCRFKGNVYNTNTQHITNADADACVCVSYCEFEWMWNENELITIPILTANECTAHSTLLCCAQFPMIEWEKGKNNVPATMIQTTRLLKWNKFNAAVCTISDNLLLSHCLIPLMRCFVLRTNSINTVYRYTNNNRSMIWRW